MTVRAKLKAAAETVVVLLLVGGVFAMLVVGVKLVTFGY